MNCYIDTMTAYVKLKIAPRLDSSKAKWRFFKKTNPTADTHYFVQYRRMTCRYFPDRYGEKQLWVTFSIPKLLRDNDNNLFPVKIDTACLTLWEKVKDILKDIFFSLSCPKITAWQVSRADMFLLHRINPRHRKWYLEAYSRLSLGSYVPYKYKNTFYLNSSLKKNKAAGTVVRIYPKLLEMQQTLYPLSLSEEMPRQVDKDFNSCIEVNERISDFIRIEFQFRRRTLRYFFQKAKSVTVADVMKESFQIDRINRMIMRLGLHRKILSRKHMKEKLDQLFTKQPTKIRAKNYISLVNSRGTYPKTIQQNFTKGQISYIRQKLHKNNLHTVVSEFEDLEPVKLLK